MRVFVTGGTGFLGSHLVASLHHHGHHVVCLVREPAKANIFNKKPELIFGDLLNERALAAGVKGAEAVFHVAGLTSATSRAAYHQTNVEGTRSVCRVTEREASGLRHFVYVSSLAAVGPSQRGIRLIGDIEPQPVSRYGWSKLAGEDAVRESDLPWTIVRPAAAYGPGDTAFLTLFRMVARGGAIQFGRVPQEVSLIYGPDLGEALAATLGRSVVGKTYFAAHDEIHTSADLARYVYQAVTKSTGSPRIIVLPELATRLLLGVVGTTSRLFGRTSVLTSDRANDFLAPAWTCSSAELQRDTGWMATTDLVSGVAMTLEWYRRNEWL